MFCSSSIWMCGANRSFDFGFNQARVWLLNTSVHHCLPWEWPNFYDDLPKCTSLLAEYGIYTDFTVFTQTRTLMPDPNQQVDHLQRTWAALAQAPCIVSLVNENNMHDNAVCDEVLTLNPPAGMAF